MTNSKTTNPLTIGLLVIALNTSIPNMAFAGGTTGGDTAGTTTTDTTTGIGDGVDQENDWGWIGLLGLLGLLGLKGRDKDLNTRNTR